MQIHNIYTDMQHIHKHTDTEPTQIHNIDRNRTHTVMQHTYRHTYREIHPDIYITHTEIHNTQTCKHRYTTYIDTYRYTTET